MGFFLLFTAFYGFFQLNFSLLIFSILFDNSQLQLEQYEYAASGILYPADSNAPENIIHEYGIKELKCEN